MRLACAHGDLDLVVQAFGSRGESDEWRRDADGLSLPQLVVLFEWRRLLRSPIRHPSGLRQARAAWMAELTAERRRVITADIAQVYGLPHPKVPAGAA